MKTPITAVILTKNEEKNIEDCLKTLLWCSEIIVIDDFSTDKTVEIAEKHGVKVLTRHLGNDFSTQRNFGLSNAENDWVLFVDADERVPQQLQQDIETAIQSEIYKGFFIKRTDYMWGKELRYGETGNMYLLRLGKKNHGKWIGNVHEVWNIEGEYKYLNTPLDHLPHQSLTEFLKDINFYTSLRAEELYDKKYKASWISIISYPKAKFFVNYILKLGFLDGIHGLLHAILMSFHSFLVRGKLWLLWNKK